MYEIGAVLFWKNNAFQSDGVIKDRYFIYLGSSSQISFHVNIYTVTTTSRTYYYQSGGSRDEHSHFKLEGGTFGLPEDSIVDINLNYMPYHSETVSDAAPDIQQVGKIDCEALKAIYKLVTFSRKVPPKEKFDIYSCFVECGISGIERPKKQKKTTREVLKFIKIIVMCYSCEIFMMHGPFEDSFHYLQRLLIIDNLKS